MIPSLNFLSPLVFLLWFLNTAYSQVTSYDFSFIRSQDIPVWHGNNKLSTPWVGGLNSVRFSEIDLDLDGNNDLVAFEKHGNRILPFLYRDSGFVFAPELIHRFPNLHDWAIFKDYNHDSKADIFTYSLAGVAVYKNTSADSLSFELVTEQLTAIYYNGYVNIFASPDDYLVVEDVDGDGRIDLLNFWVLGKYVHFLKNYSEDPNTFDFHLESECWGHFAEAADNNTISLFTDCELDNRKDIPLRHTGSSMLLHDFTGNGLPDVLIGDIDSPHLIFLQNHGTLADARMTNQDTCFPTSFPVNLFSMPAPALIQLPNKERPSLIVSPSDPSLTKSQDMNSVWQYDYDSLMNTYTLSSTSFLQQDMIDLGSGCYPFLYDWDNDGLVDLFLSNYGCLDSTKLTNGFPNSFFSSSIFYYKNIGNNSRPEFQLQTNDFGHLKQHNYQALYPTFGDFDGDGLTDMLCGQRDGSLIFVPYSYIFDQTGNITEHFLNIDVGDFSTPQYFDLDNDGKKDLIIGNRRGTICYYKNVGNGQLLDFSLITDTLGGVDVRDFDLSYFGFSTPMFYRNNDGGTILFCGSEQGKIFYYNHIDNNLSGHFNLTDNNLSEAINGKSIPFKEGKRIGCALEDLNRDGYPEIVIGNYAGGCAFFYGCTPLPRPTRISSLEDAFRIFPNPTSGSLHVHPPSPAPTEIFLYDVFGRQLLHTSCDLLDLRDLPAGVYIIDVNHRYRKKIIKQ